MRKYLILLLSLIVLICGCSSPQNDSDSLFFYYYSTSALYDNSEHVIYAQPMGEDLNTMSLKDIAAQYLKGPTAENLDMPFTQGTTVTAITEENNAITITLSAECSTVQQLELSLAGSCLARTLFQFTQAQSITVQSEDGFSYAENELIFTRSNILTADMLNP